MLVLPSKTSAHKQNTKIEGENMAVTNICTRKLVNSHLWRFALNAFTASAFDRGKLLQNSIGT